MSTTITIRDESTGGKTLHQWALEVLTERITVRELIRSRVYQEVKDYNVRQPQVFRGLVQPTEAEQTLNGVKLRKGHKINWKEQFDRAVEAFQRKQVLVLVDDEQVESLEEEVEIRPDTVVSFLKLTLLVGG
jgi:hypothetical protein